MSRFLVLFASHYGQTRVIAEAIASRLRGYGHEVALVDARSGAQRASPPEDFDVVVLGSRIEMGRHASDISAYIDNHRAALRDMPTAFFSVSMAASDASAGPDPARYMGTLFDEHGWHPTRCAAIAGGLPYRKYGWITRLVMKGISRKHGHPTDTSRNHELTDWKAVDRFADEVAALAPGREAEARWM